MFLMINWSAIMMPAGKYYVGDLCYVMHPQWSEVCDLIFSNMEDNSEYTLGNGVKFAVHHTLYGDGTYFDESNLSYSVDAGLIGCILVSDIKDLKQSPEGGNYIDFDQPFETSRDIDGTIMFGAVKIKTGDEDEDEYVEDEEEDY